MNFTEDQLEQAFLEMLESLGWEHIDGRKEEIAGLGRRFKWKTE